MYLKLKRLGVLLVLPTIAGWMWSSVCVLIPETLWGIHRQTPQQLHFFSGC